jgi:hypothetical protein
MSYYNVPRCAAIDLKISFAKSVLRQSLQVLFLTRLSIQLVRAAINEPGRFASPKYEHPTFL